MSEEVLPSGVKALVDLILEHNVSTVIVNHEVSSVDIYYRDGTTTSVPVAKDSNDTVE